MKNIIIGIVVALLLIGGIAGAAVLYNNLSEDYGNNGGFAEFQPSGNSSTQSKPEETTEAITPSETTEKTDAPAEETTENKNGSVAETTTESESSVGETTEREEPVETDETTKKDETTEEKEPVVAFSAPDFTVIDYDGNSVKLSDFAGKPIVLNFWGTWCPYCVQEMPVFDQAYKDFPDVQFIMLNSGDTVAKAKTYVESQGFDFEVFFDTDNNAQTTYGVYSFPTTFFINADGSKIYYISGALDYETLLTGINLIK